MIIITITMILKIENNNDTNNDTSKDNNNNNNNNDKNNNSDVYVRNDYDNNKNTMI